jgi:hypothetical protein
MQQQLNRKALEDREEKSLRGLRGLCGSSHGDFFGSKFGAFNTYCGD